MQVNYGLFTPQEQGKLKEILSKSSQLQTADNRINFIASCGLDIYSGSIQVDKNPDNFFTNLMAVFCKNNVKNDSGEEKLALVIFLEHFIQLEDNLSQEDKDLIEHFIQKYQVKQTKKENCPYRGLSAFREEDTDLFFGREEFVEQLVDAVKKHPLVPVIGASGSGKSSVVLAGLIPRLRAEGTWLIESFRPNKQPFYEIAAALISQLEPELGKTDKNIKAKKLAESIRQHGFTEDVSAIVKDNPGKRLLLVVDQFEELYALDHQTQKQFVDVLLDAIKLNSSLKLVLTIRHEFLDYIINYHPLKEKALQPHGHKFLGTMSREEMISVIELIDNSF